MKTKLFIAFLFATLTLTACSTEPTQNNEVTEQKQENTVETTVEYTEVTPETTPEATEAPKKEVVVYDENGIKITYIGLDTDSLFGPELKFSIENNTDKNICVQNRDDSINGYMVSGNMSQSISAGKKAVSAITYFSSSLEENCIDQIETVELKFSIFDDETYDDIADTDVIEINVLDM